MRSSLDLWYYNSGDDLWCWEIEKERKQDRFFFSILMPLIMIYFFTASNIGLAFLVLRLTGLHLIRILAVNQSVSFCCQLSWTVEFHKVICWACSGLHLMPLHSVHYSLKVRLTIICWPIITSYFLPSTVPRIIQIPNLCFMFYAYVLIMFSCVRSKQCWTLGRSRKLLRSWIHCPAACVLSVLLYHSELSQFIQLSDFQIL